MIFSPEKIGCSRTIFSPEKIEMFFFTSPNRTELNVHTHNNGRP